MLNIRFGAVEAGAASRYGSKCTKIMWFRLRNTAIYILYMKTLKYDENFRAGAPKNTRLRNTDLLTNPPNHIKIIGMENE
jgi:hypothetical protein